MQSTLFLEREIVGNAHPLIADGQIRTCLFSLGEYDLKPALRGAASDAERESRANVMGKEARHHIGGEEFEHPDRSMSCIGG